MCGTSRPVRSSCDLSVQIRALLELRVAGIHACVFPVRATIVSAVSESALAWPGIAGLGLGASGRECHKKYAESQNSKKCFSHEQELQQGEYKVSGNQS